MQKNIDYLSEDMPLSGQKFCLISFVSPSGNQKCDVNGVKVRGSFDTLEEANKVADRLRNTDPDFDIYVASVGKWLPWYPDPKTMPDINYQESQLNQLVKGHKENQIMSKQHFEERKRDLMEKAMSEGTKSGQKELAEKPMHPIAVKESLETTNKLLEEMKEELKKLSAQKTQLEDLMGPFTDEDLALDNNRVLEGVSEINRSLFESENISPGSSK